MVAGLAGFDDTLVQRLEPRHSAWLGSIGVGSALGALLVGAACGYVGYLLLGSPAAGAAALLAGALFFFNILRLANAGGGAAPSQPFESWKLRPWWPFTVWLVGLVLAQPLVTFVLRGHVDEVIAENRYAIRAVHRATVMGEIDRELAAVDAQLAAIQGGRDEVTDEPAPSATQVPSQRRERLETRRHQLEEARSHAISVVLPGYEAHLDRSGFLADRFRAVWTWPVRAGLLTLAISLLIAAGPLLRWPARSAMYAYQQLRWEQDREIIESSYEASLAERTRLLAAYGGSFTGIRCYFADPPYNTKFLPFGEAASRMKWEELLARLPKGSK